MCGGKIKERVGECKQLHFPLFTDVELGRQLLHCHQVGEITNHGPDTMGSREGMIPEMNRPEFA